MNRITIEPGPQPNQWAHIWYKDFTVVRTEYHTHGIPFLTEADALWIQGKYVWVNPPPILTNQFARSEWYTEEEKKQFAAGFPPVHGSLPASSVAPYMEQGPGLSNYLGSGY